MVWKETLQITVQLGTKESAPCQYTIFSDKNVVLYMNVELEKGQH